MMWCGSLTGTTHRDCMPKTTTNGKVAMTPIKKQNMNQDEDNFTLSPTHQSFLQVGVDKTAVKPKEIEILCYFVS